MAVTPTRAAAADGGGGRRRGALGAVLLLSAPLTLALTGGAGPLVWGKLALGGGLTASWLRRAGASARRRLAGRAAGLTAASAAGAALSVAAVVALNAVVAAHPRSLDLTREQLYTLSEQTTAVLGRLHADVEVLAFYANTEAEYARAEELLARYREASPRLRARVVAPQARPDLVERYQIGDRGPRLVVLQGGREARAKEPSEQALTAAVVQVAERAPQRIYALTGHGEGSLEEREDAAGFGQLAGALAGEGYLLAPLDFASLPAPTAGAAPLALPEDAALLLLLPAAHPLSAPERDALAAYLAAGGRAVVHLEPHRDAGLAPLLGQWGIAAHDDVIVDASPLGRLLGLGPAAPMVHMAAGAHPIVEKIAQPAVMHTARALHRLEAEAATEAVALAHAGESAWGETALAADGTARRDPADHAPPLDVAFAAVRPSRGDAPRAAQGRLVVFGDGDFVSNRYLGMQANRDLMLNAVGWAAAREDRIAIRPALRPGTQLLLTGGQLQALSLVTMDLLPMLIAACGVAVVLARRQA